MSIYLKFDLSLDKHTLRQELDFCLKELWVSHFNQNDYEGQWNCIALRSKSGQITDILPIFTEQPYRDTSLMDRLPYTKSVLDSIPGVKESVRYMALYPGAVIKPHRDRGCNYEDGVYRIHIPIQTNDGVEFYVDDQRLFLKEGECWYINFDKVHHIHNRGKEVRVHLVIDGLRTAETDVWFNQQGYREVKKPKYDEATKKAMIAQLELLDTDTARQLIDQLREET